MAARFEAGAAAVQASDVVANPEASWSSALRYASFALIDTARPLGKSTLGLSCGLFGTGMGFSRAILERRPWSAGSLAEDQEHHAALVAAGERVAFIPEASVSSAMPAALRDARSQHLRWETGRWQLLRRTPALVRQAIRRRNPDLLHVALEPLVPPQAPLLAGGGLVALISALSGARAATWLALIALGGQAAFVVGGLALVRAPAAVWRALALAPLLVAWKLLLWARVLTGRGPSDWVRTRRS
jgi:cellulose synthase/poly-beta-1,6-N-acetylglucosamine synthase-like glycosyltransferase